MDFIVLVCFAATFTAVYTNQNLDTARNNAVQHADSIIQPAAIRYTVKHGKQTARSDAIVSSPHKNSDPPNLKLAAFNVQIFGTNKMSTPGVPEILVKIILRYDIILIQEIRDSSGKAIKHLLSLVNKDSTGSKYNISISPRLGRSSSKEEYAFLYRKDVVSVKRSYVYDDGNEDQKNDTFEREPYIVHFTSTRTKLTDFVLVAIHTSPSKANQEIHELAAVYDDVIRRLSITDVIILGDLNAACSYMSDSDWKTNRLAKDKRFHWLISDCVDTTVAGGHCAYDRFVVAGDAMLNAVIESSAGSYEYGQDLDVNKTMAALVSDHYPVEIQVFSKELSTAVSYVSTAIEYTFQMKKPSILSKHVIFRNRKNIEAAGLTVERTKNNRGAYSGMTFKKDFENLKEALDAIQIIREKACPVEMISVNQARNAEFHVKGAWITEKKLLVKKTGAVKLVCAINQTPSCWIAILINNPDDYPLLISDKSRINWGKK